MWGLAAWIATFWLLSIPLNATFIGKELNGAEDWTQILLICIISWILANRVESAVNRYVYSRRNSRG